VWLCTSTLSLFAQGSKITGTVTDTQGEPIIGANIVVKGTTNGFISDINGKFTLQVDPNAILSISYVGYNMQEVVVGKQTILKIVLTENSLGLDEVVVIGYGTTRRKDYTGSVSSVKIENSALSTLPNLNVLESLKGNVSGLNIGATNSAGGDPSMLIRGQNSINGDNNPLIILDGVIYMGNIGDINPNDIANIDVLKDAVSSAAYGSRSANGVIAINTKKGRTEKPVITFNTSVAMQNWQGKPDLVSPEQYIARANDIAGNPPGTISWLREGELRNYNAGISTYYLDDVVRTGSIQDYQVAVSGSGPKINYYLSTSFEKNKGVILGDDFDRLSLFGKIDANITDWLNIGIDARYSRRDYSGLAADLGSALNASVFGTKYYDGVHLEKTPMQPGGSNPLWDALSGSIDNTDIRKNLLLNVYAVVKVPWIDGLSYKINYLPNEDRRRYGNFYYELNYVPEGPNADRYTPAALQSLLAKANGNIANAETSSYVLDNILTYNKTIGKHSIEGTLVATRDETKYEIINTSGSDFSENGNTLLGINGLHKAKIQKTDLNGATKRSNIGYFGRISYSFGGKYYFIGSYRRDGASVFGANKKWGNFAGASVAWAISKEQFMKGVEPLDNLKLKFAWGQNGNQGISPYTTLSQVNNGPSGGIRYEFSDTREKIFYGLIQSSLGNHNLGWENTDAINVGFESAWLKNRLFVDVDIYHTQTFNQIFNRTIPSMTGFTSMYASMGQVNNTGVDITLRSVNIENKDWTWITGVTAWKNNNKLVHLYGDDLDGDGKEDDDIANSLFIGKSLGAIYGYKQDGVVQENDKEYMELTGATPGMPKYADIDGVPGISSTDRSILGYKKENFRLSLSNNVRYKAFELYVMVAGVFGGNNYFLASNPSAFISNTNGGFAGGSLIYKPYWTPENKSNVYPNGTFNNDGRFLGLQSRSFLRIQDISLSYSFDNTPWVKSANINSLKVFLAIKNLATFSDWFGIDPETGGQYGNSFPVPTSYSLGLNLSF
jgi:TonB-linked SusC/RagA family outer membrane protein